MSNLSKCINQVTVLEYVDLSGYFLSPWSFYCSIIRHHCVTSLTLCEDKGMKYCVKNIRDSLQTNRTLQLLTLCASMWKNAIGNFKEATEKLSYWRKLEVYQWWWEMNNNIRVMNVKILYDGLNGCLSQNIDLLDLAVNDNAVCLIQQ